MTERIIRNDLLGEQYYEIEHDSGLRVLVMELPRYTGAFAMFGTRFGSVDTCFKRSDEADYTTVPDGIAHFLEHKLFESEEKDAFERFNRTGASANAFTSYDRTCYLFQCADRVEENLEILLDFVTHPYFTEETVQKEQGIIGQEIRMYQDNPDWVLVLNLLRAIYHANPARLDIAGSVESIAEITPALLYACYRTFYNHSNMVLAVAGNVTKEQVLAVCDRALQKEAPVRFEQIVPEEPDTVAQPYIEAVMPVELPKFALGFKQPAQPLVRSDRETVAMEIALDIAAGKLSPLYHALLEKGLINPSFSAFYFTGRGFAVPMIVGESADPAAVREAVLARIEALQQNGISDEDFSLSRKQLYGRAVRGFNDVDDLAYQLTDACFRGSTLFGEIESFRAVTKEDVTEMLGRLQSANSSFSVVKGAKV